MEDAVERAKVNSLIDQTSFLQVTGQTNRHQLQQVRVAEFAAKGEGKKQICNANVSWKEANSCPV